MDSAGDKSARDLELNCKKTSGLCIVKACRSRYICNLYLFLRCFPRQFFLMATDISHVLDVSTYFVLVYP